MRKNGKKKAHVQQTDVWEMGMERDGMRPSLDRIPLEMSIQWPLIQLGRALRNITQSHRQFFRMDHSDLKKIYVEKSKAAKDRGSTTKSLSYMERAVQIDPKDPDIVYELGLAYERNGYFDDAQKTYQRVTEMQSDHAKAHYRKGMVYFRKKEYTDAIKEFEIAQKIEPKSEHLYYHMGQAFDRLQKHEKAIRLFKKAVEINHSFLPAYKNMALTYDSLNRHKEALACLKRALEIEEMSE